MIIKVKNSALLPKLNYSCKQFGFLKVFSLYNNLLLNFDHPGHALNIHYWYAPDTRVSINLFPISNGCS